MVAMGKLREDNFSFNTGKWKQASSGPSLWIIACLLPCHLYIINNTFNKSSLLVWQQIYSSDLSAAIQLNTFFLKSMHFFLFRSRIVAGLKIPLNNSSCSPGSCIRGTKTKCTMGIILSGLSWWRTADYSKHQQQLSVVSQQQTHKETCTHAYQGSSPLSYTAIEPHKLPLRLHAINKRGGEMLICDIRGQKGQHIKSKTFDFLVFLHIFHT